MEFKIRQAFICDNCRECCKGGCHEQLEAILDGSFEEGMDEYERAKDLLGRKQIIHCLGPYCSNPCYLQREEYTPYRKTDGVRPLIDSINYLGNKCNSLIESGKG